jgi:hypothetical protein
MKRSRTIVGYILVGFAAVCVFVGISPIFPIRGEAFITGIISFGAGTWVLLGSDLRDTIRRGLRAARSTRRSTTRGPGRPSSPPIAIDPLLPVQILKLAQVHSGVLTVAQVAMELNVPLDHAQEAIDRCVQAGNAVADFNVTRGHALYRFPEFLPAANDQLPE